MWLRFTVWASTGVTLAIVQAKNAQEPWGGPRRASPHLVVCVELLVLALALPQGLPLSLQRLRQVRVLQALLRVLLRQHLQLALD